LAIFIVLDTGPLGLACGNASRGEGSRLVNWLTLKETEGLRILLPEIADYELRRKLIHQGMHDALGRLDKLHDRFEYLPINTRAMQRAAQLWAELRRGGRQTADDRSLDGDVILAAQVLEHTGLRDEATIATANVNHLSRFKPLKAAQWGKF